MIGYQIYQKFIAEIRKMILFIENFTAHSYDIYLPNIKLKYLLPNTKSLIQPIY